LGAEFKEIPVHLVSGVGGLASVNPQTEPTEPLPAPGRPFRRLLGSVRRGRIAGYLPRGQRVCSSLVDSTKRRLRVKQQPATGSLGDDFACSGRSAGGRLQGLSQGLRFKPVRTYNKK
jgi:hypothetical protein